MRFTFKCFVLFLEDALQETDFLIEQGRLSIVQDTTLASLFGPDEAKEAIPCLAKAIVLRIGQRTKGQHGSEFDDIPSEILAVIETAGDLYEVTCQELDIEPKYEASC